MLSRKEKPNSTATATAAAEDLISPLPDQIIHGEIFDRLSAKEAARTAVLSKRWNLLWRSYPTLEFHHNETSTSTSDQNTMAAALGKMSSRRPHIRSVRISADLSRPFFPSKPFRALLNRIMGYSANNSSSSSSPRLIDIDLGCTTSSWSSSGHQYRVPQDILLYRGLKVLRLRNCYFRNHNYYNSLRNCSTVKVLCLRNVQFMDDGILNSMLRGASSLENLTLSCVRGIGRFRVVNHPSLKLVTVQHSWVGGFEIAGAQSLQVLTLVDLGKCEQLDVSSNPNLKLVDLRDIPVLTDEMLNGLISKLPFLERLVFECRASATGARALKIVHSDSLREIEINASSVYPNQSSTIEIDAPRLTNLVYRANRRSIHGLRSWDLPPILFKTTTSSNETTTPVSFWFELCGSFDYLGLKWFIARQSQFRFTLHVTDFGSSTLPSNPVPHEQPIPMIECLKFKSSILSENRDFINIMFWTCHPKSLSVEVEQNHPSSNHYLFGLEYLCEQLTNRDDSDYGCAVPCKCWRHTSGGRVRVIVPRDQFEDEDSIEHCISPCKCWQLHLNDVKIIAPNNNGSSKGDQLVNVSSDIISSLVDPKVKEIRFLLDWN